jgi:hypothetical protein
MANVYKQEVDASNIVRHKSMKGLAVASFVIAAFYLYLGAIIAALVMARFGSFALFTRRYALLSYSYEIKDGEISVEKIIDRKQRKKIINFKISDIIIMAPEKNEKISQLGIKQDRTMAFHMRGMIKGVYTILTKADGKVYKLKLAPDKKFIDLCLRQNSAKVIRE